MSRAMLLGLLVLGACQDDHQLRTLPDGAPVTVDGAVADAEVLADGALISSDAEVIPDAEIAPDADPCATPTAGDWVGTTRRYEAGNGSQIDMRAEVHWTLVATQGCMDVLKPLGVASTALTAGCDPESIDPSTAAIQATDGELVIDRSVSPATYRVTGTTTWIAIETCNEEMHQDAVGGLWVEAHGSFDGALIAGRAHVAEEVADELPEVILAWDFHPDGVTFPAPAPCAEPATETWTFTSRISGGAAAEVTWTRVSTADCVDRFVPSGTATQVPPPSALQDCDPLVYEPNSVAIASGDGELIVDRGTSPPTYLVYGANDWIGNVTCTHPDGEVTSHEANLGGPWASFAGAYDGDDFSAATAHNDYTAYAWRFTR